MYMTMSYRPNKMDPEKKRRWIEALRSGDYNQGRGAFCQIDDDGEACYCVLGVLIEETWGEDVWQEGTKEAKHASMLRGGPPGELFVNGDAGISLRQQLKMGFSRDNEWGGHQIAKDNDIGVSFELIADRLERGIYGI